MAVSNEEANRQVDLISAPSDNYVVKAPIDISSVSIMSTPNFKEKKLFVYQAQVAEGREEIKEEEEQEEVHLNN